MAVDLKVCEKPLGNFRVSERTRLLLRAGAADDMLGSLPGEAEWKALNPDGPSLKEKRDSLVAVREEALAAFKAQPLDPAAGADRRRHLTRGLPVCAGASPVPYAGKRAKNQGLGAMVNRVFTDGPCPEPESRPETIFIDPEFIGKEFSNPDEPWYSESTMSTPDGTKVDFTLNIRDMNNDPWNEEFVEGWLRIAWLYRLPVRSYDTLRDFSIYGRMSAGTGILSNNVLGHRRWRGIFCGDLALTTEAIHLIDTSQPFYHSRWWTQQNDSWDSTEKYLTKSVFIEAGEEPPMLLYFWIYLFADRGATISTGTLQAYDPYAPELCPRLRCTIRQVL
jgi:hypothetical protein